MTDWIVRWLGVSTTLFAFGCAVVQASSRDTGVVLGTFEIFATASLVAVSIALAVQEEIKASIAVKHE